MQEFRDTQVLEPAEAAARFRAARRTGQPAWLWPDVEPAAWRAALQELERVAGALLAGDAQVRIASLPLRPLGVAAYTSGLGPWLGWHVERGLLGAEAGAADLLAEHLEQSRGRWVQLAGGLETAVQALGAAGLPATVLKGAHTAQLFFAEPALRPMADLDLLVDAADVGAAGAALQAAGFVEDRAARHTRPYRAEWRRTGSAQLPRSLDLSHAEDPWAIDLHGSLNIGFDGVRTVEFDAALPAHIAAAPWAAGATVVRQPLLAAQLAVHAAHGLHGATLIRLVELVLVLRRDVRTAEQCAALAGLLQRLDAERFAYPALLLAERLAPGTVDGALLDRLAAAAPPRMRAVLAGLTPAGAQRLERLELGERFMWSGSVLEHARRALHMLLPGGRVPPRRLARIYGVRLWRLLRGRVVWGS